MINPLGQFSGAYTASKTALIGLSICLLATAVVVTSAAVDYMNFRATGESFSVPYVPELFLLYISIFGGIAGKNGLDNWSQTRKETQLEVTRINTGTTLVSSRPTPPIS